MAPAGWGERTMTAQLLTFPMRAPFAVEITREDAAWLVICRAHSWLFGSRAEALIEARDLARGFGVVAQFATEASQ